MEAEDLVEHKDHFAAPPTGAINELHDVGNEDEIEDQVSNGSKVALIQNYLHGDNLRP